MGTEVELRVEERTQVNAESRTEAEFGMEVKLRTEFDVTVESRMELLKAKPSAQVGANDEHQG